MEKINLIDTTPKSKTYTTLKMKTDGIDNGKCVYRAIINQQEKGMDINFGFTIVKQKYNHNPQILNYMGWCIPYDYHVWNEDDENIYDSLTAFNEQGITLPENPNTLLIDWSNRKIKNMFQLQTLIKKFIKNMRNSKADIVYVSGIGESGFLDKVIDWNDLEFIIHSSCKQIQEVTGDTMNNVVEYV